MIKSLKIWYHPYCLSSIVHNPSSGFYHMPSGEVPRQEFAGDLCSESRLITWLHFGNDVASMESRPLIFVYSYTHTRLNAYFEHKK